MIVVLNCLLANIIRLISLIRIRLSASFKAKYLHVKGKIKNTGTLNFHLECDLVHCVVAIEDKRFFKHSGIDLYSIIRAFYNNTTTNRIEGASTINQQLVRSITNERKINTSRKVNEIMLATLIEYDFTKMDILNAYLEIYQFFNSKGILNLCENENYNINSLTLFESAQIAARLKYPSITSFNYIKYLKRVRTIEILVSLNRNNKYFF